MTTASSDDDHVAASSSSSSEGFPRPQKAARRKRGRSQLATSNTQPSPKSASSRIIPEFSRPLKRRRSASPCPEAYQSLFQAACNGSDRLEAEYEEDPYETSYIGISEWTGNEKEILFEALARHGRDDVRHIATKIGSKSQLEVEAYLIALQEGADRLEHSVEDAEPRHLSVSSTAVELSRYCESRVEAAAKALAGQDLDLDDEAERAKYGMAWLLDHSLVDAITYSNFRVDRALQPLGADADEPLRALELFDLPMFLRLSTDYFMRSHDPEWSYSTHGATAETPSIRLSALTEIYRLVEAFTERLIVSAHHCALSRLQSRQAESSTKERTRQLVWPQDVAAAVETLRVTSPLMPLSLEEYWLRFREKLVDDDRQRLANLDAERDMDAGMSNSSPQPATAHHTEDAMYTTQPQSPGLRDDRKAASEDPSDSSAEEEAQSSGDDDETVMKLEEYMERLDASAAQWEESRILRACGMALPERKLQKRLDIPIPRDLSENLPDRLDWRMDVNYRPTWERFSDPPSAAESDNAESETGSEEETDSDAEPVVVSIETDQMAGVVRGQKPESSALSSKRTQHQGEGEADSQASMSSRWSSHDPDSPTHQANPDEEDTQD